MEGAGMKYLDLFSGMGGFTRGLLDAGFTFDWHGFSEIDKYAKRLYAALYPGAEDMGDVKAIDDRRLLERFGQHGIDIITFGFPCQDLSIAGNRKGLEGKRSGLFFEALRIIKTVQPPCFIFENVKGLLQCGEGRDFKTVLQSIADLGLYDCQWQLCNTNWFLPQDRERIYFVGLLRGQRKFGREIFPLAEIEKFGSRIKIKGEIQRCDTARCMTARQYASWNGNYVRVGTIRRFNDKDSLSKCDENGFREIKSGNCPTITAGAREDGSGQPCIKEGDRIRRLTPLECFRLQFGMENASNMIAKAKELGISDTQLYKMAGNAVSSPVVQLIAERLKCKPD
jgi:DNA (cytosine-5)-methyltransferase 1